MDKEKLVNRINKFWDDKIIPALIEYIKIHFPVLDVCTQKTVPFLPDFQGTCIGIH